MWTVMVIVASIAIVILATVGFVVWKRRKESRPIFNESGVNEEVIEIFMNHDPKRQLVLAGLAERDVILQDRCMRRVARRQRRFDESMIKLRRKMRSESSKSNKKRFFNAVEMDLNKSPNLTDLKMRLMR